MRPALRLLAAVKPVGRVLEPGAPTGLCGLLTHPAPRSTLVYLYSRTLDKLKQFPESSVYRQSTEALTRHRLSIIERIEPAGLKEWEERVQKQVEANPDAFEKHGVAVRRTADGRAFIVVRQKGEVDEREEEWDGEITSDPEPEGVRSSAERLRKPHFYEVFSSAFSSHRLKIPDGFVCRMEGRTYGSLSLIGPSGNVWTVQLLKQDNDLFFHHGWSSFVVDHSLECGDLLVFRYEGHLHFTVQVFDKDACEKEAAFISECSQSSSDFEAITGQKRGTKESSSLDIAFDGVSKKMRGCKYENQEHEPGFVGKDLLRYEVVRPIRMFRETEETSKACLANDALVPFHTDNRNEEAAIMYRSGKEDGSYFLGGVSLSNVSAQDEKKVAQSFTSNYPYFVRIMKSFNVSGSYTLNIPYQFSMAHLPNCKIKIILHNLKGEHWTVNSVPTTRVHTSHTLCGGWMAFVRGNSITVGDICIFELVHKCELRVHIAGVGNDGLDCQVGRVNAGHVGPPRYMPTNAKVNSKCIRKVDVSNKKWPKIGQETVLSIDLKKSGRASNASKHMGLCPQSKVAHKKLATPRRHRVEDELSSQAKAGLRMLFALDEQRVAQAFSSPFPSFVKIMKKFNVSGSYTLKIPYQFSAAHLPTYKTEVILRNSRGECWTVNSVPDAKGRTVHTFCGGWMAFVRDNDINFGDTCIFELVTQSEMQVYISGVGKEGPDHQNGHLKLDRLANLPSTC